VFLERNYKVFPKKKNYKVSIDNMKDNVRERGNYGNNMVSLPFFAHERRLKKWVGPTNNNLSSTFHLCSKR